MSNFREAFEKGQQGSNIGLPMGEGLEDISVDIRGTQRAMIYVIAAAPKGGKSTFVDNAFVIAPCLFVMINNALYHKYILEGLTQEQIFTQYNIRYLDFEIIYNSYEMDRITKEFDFATHFLCIEHGIQFIKLEEGITVGGKNTIELCSDYLRGRIVDDNKKLVTVKPSIVEVLVKVYNERIIPLFGQYDSQGKLEKKGIIIFLEHRENPTGIRKYLINHAEKNGVVHYEKFIGTDGKTHQKMIGYTPLNPDKTTYVITDHMRKLVREQKFTLKETVDKFSEYAVELKNIIKYTFVHIIHLNRSMTDVSRMKHQDDMLYPNSDDVKETGNLAEDCDFMFTLFNPNDDRYQLNKHFGKMIKDIHGNLLFPNLRSIHLVENRHGPYPLHYRTNMFGATKRFEKIKT